MLRISLIAPVPDLNHLEAGYFSGNLKKAQSQMAYVPPSKPFFHCRQQWSALDDERSRQKMGNRRHHAPAGQPALAQEIVEVTQQSVCAPVFLATRDDQVGTG